MNPQTYLPYVAETLNNLGVLQNDKNKWLFDNLEALFKKYGGRDLYNQHFSQYPNLKGDTIETNRLLKLIHKTQKSVEQEILIKKLM